MASTNIEIKGNLKQIKDEKLSLNLRQHTHSHIPTHSTLKYMLKPNKNTQMKNNRDCPQNGSDWMHDVNLESWPASDCMEDRLTGLVSCFGQGFPFFLDIFWWDDPKHFFSRSDEHADRTCLLKRSIDEKQSEKFVEQIRSNRWTQCKSSWGKAKYTNAQNVFYERTWARCWREEVFSAGGKWKQPCTTLRTLYTVSRHMHKARVEEERSLSGKNKKEKKYGA